MISNALEDVWYAPWRGTSPRTAATSSETRSKTMSSKIVGYLRVSTAGQADNGHTIDAQRGAIKAES